jgi:hypothetical protein
VGIASAALAALSGGAFFMTAGCRNDDGGDSGPKAPKGSSASAVASSPDPNDPTPAFDKSLLCDTGGQTDNSACLVCHLDFEREELAAQHVTAHVVCAGCHGRSEAHRSDELNITKPDVLYGRSAIDPFCVRCHPTHKDPGKLAEYLNQWRGVRRPNGRMVQDDSVCTDCHGQHAILRPEQIGGEEPVSSQPAL